MKFLAISLFLGIAACSPVSMHPGEMPTLCILKEVNSFGTCLFARENADHFVAIGKAFETLQGGRQIGDFGNFIQKFAMFCHQTDETYNYDTCEGDAISTVAENTAYYAETIGNDLPASDCRQFLTSNGAEFADALLAITQAGGDICQPSQ
ncbi:hypothetical protein N7513_004271 [Penicillium frequentans]|nr:hypothetical protein N7513_004271 [Penicillium glabrum]